MSTGVPVQELVTLPVVLLQELVTSPGYRQREQVILFMLYNLLLKTQIFAMYYVKPFPTYNKCAADNFENIPQSNWKLPSNECTIIEQS